MQLPELHMKYYSIHFGDVDMPMHIQIQGRQPPDGRIGTVVRLHVRTDWSANKPVIAIAELRGKIDAYQVECNITKEHFTLYSEYLKDWRDNPEKVDLTVSAGDKFVRLNFTYKCET